MHRPKVDFVRENKQNNYNNLYFFNWRFSAVFVEILIILYNTLNSIFDWNIVKWFLIFKILFLWRVCLTIRQVN